MKVQTIHGVPYHINESNQVFFYEKTLTGSKPAIGTWDATQQRLTLFSEWQTIVHDTVKSYRAQLNEHTEKELQKARELQKV
jgi:hypothetical protein